MALNSGYTCSLVTPLAYRLARLRWRNAFAVLGTWSRQSTIQSGGQRSKGQGQLLAKVRTVNTGVAAFVFGLSAGLGSLGNRVAAISWTVQCRRVLYWLRWHAGCL